MAEDTPEQKKKVPKKGIRTYQKDMAEVLGKQQRKGAFIKTAIAEQKKKEQEMLSRSLKSKKNLFFVVAGTVLLLVGLLLVFFIVASKKEAVAPEKSQIEPLIFADTYKEIDITDLSKAKIASAIRAEIRGKLEFDTIKNILITERVAGGKQLVSISRFLSVIESSAPTDLPQSLRREFMIGIHSGATNQLFILLKAAHHYNAFRGLLDWEEKMFDDLYLIFDIDVSGERENLFNKKFEDTFVKNKDARVIRNDEGKIVLMYLFIDPQTIIITTSVDTLDEILSRL